MNPLKTGIALKVDGFTDEHIVELRSPIGTNHQTEIAIYIIAEVIQVRD